MNYIKKIIHISINPSIKKRSKEITQTYDRNRIL